MYCIFKLDRYMSLIMYYMSLSRLNLGGLEIIFFITMAYLNKHCILKYFGMDAFVLSIECVLK